MVVESLVYHARWAYNDARHIVRSSTFLIDRAFQFDDEILFRGALCVMSKYQSSDAFANDEDGHAESAHNADTGSMVKDVGLATAATTQIQHHVDDDGVSPGVCSRAASMAPMQGTLPMGRLFRTMSFFVFISKQCLRNVSPLEHLTMDARCAGAAVSSSSALQQQQFPHKVWFRGAQCAALSDDSCHACYRSLHGAAIKEVMPPSSLATPPGCEFRIIYYIFSGALHHKVRRHGCGRCLCLLLLLLLLCLCCVCARAAMAFKGA